jgi:hypothetical protein
MPAVRSTSYTTKISAPYKGLNTVDPLAEMDPAFGISIQNWIATPQGLALRQGYRKWATGFGDSPKTLIPYYGKANTSSRLFAVVGESIYDITNGGEFDGEEPPDPVVTGLTASSAYWQYANQTHSTSLSNFMILVNGIDKPLLYDGTDWVECSQNGTPGAPGEFSNNDQNGTAVDISHFTDVVLHQQRWWFTTTESTKAHYCAIASAGGQLATFDFGPHFPRGGNLFKLASWTVDTGEGTRSLLVAYSNKGDCVVYKGNDPTDADTWGLVGVYQLGAPVGRRCTTPYSGDLFYLGIDGMYPMSRILQSARVDATSALTYNIGPTINSLFSTYKSLAGFEATIYPDGNLMILNIPQVNQANNFQFCYHLISKAWTQFTGWPGQTFVVFNDAMYFAGPDFVAIAFIGFKDGADIMGDGGDKIQATGLTAFSTLGAPGLKQVHLVKPYLVTGQTRPQIFVGVNTDFNLVPIVGSATVNPVSGSVWDDAVWDSPSSTWVGSLTGFNEWSTPEVWPGEYIAFAMSVSAVSDTLWTSTQYIISEPRQAFG